MKPHFDVAANKKDRAESGRTKIYDEGGIQAYHVASKEASQHLYGGGEEGGAKHGTNWCVSARSDKCKHGQYGAMYTLHDGKKFWAVHPMLGKITSQHNDGEEPIETHTDPKHKEALKAIDDHYKASPIGKLQHGKKLTDEELTSFSEDFDKIRAVDPLHFNSLFSQFGTKHIDNVLKNSDEATKNSILHHIARSSKISDNHVSEFMKSKSLKNSLLSNNNLNDKHLDMLTKDSDPDIKWSAEKIKNSRL
jgi:hypothetical protein